MNIISALFIWVTDEFEITFQVNLLSFVVTYYPVLRGLVSNSLRVILRTVRSFLQTVKGVIVVWILAHTLEYGSAFSVMRNYRNRTRLNVAHLTSNLAA